MSISTLASLGMAIGAPLVYADQAYSIYRKQDARGFSHDVCAVLLIANITRCFFWLGERFEFALLLQSLLMIAAQLGLLYLCIRFKPVTRWSKSISSDGARVVFDGQQEEEDQRRDAREGAGSMERDLMDLHAGQDGERGAEEEEDEGYANKQPLLVTLGAMFRGGSSSYGRVSSTDHSSYSSSSTLPTPNTTTSSSSSNNTSPLTRINSLFSHCLPSASGRPLNFWQWSDYNSYLVFLCLLVLLQSILYLVFSSSTLFISLLGYIALGLESTLPIPQLIANHRRKSLAGFRSSVLIGWLGGDSFKLLYFLLKASPVQFTTCAAFQLSVDLAILAQSRLYRDKTERDEEEMRKQEQGSRQRRTQAGEIEEDAEDELPSRNAARSASSSGRGATKPSRSSGAGGKGKAKAQPAGKTRSMREEDDDDLLHDPHHVIAIEADEDDDEGDISNVRTK